MPTLTAIAILSLVISSAGCTQTRSEVRGPQPTSRTPFGLRIPEDIARDPAARMTFKEQLRVQVRHKTHGVPPTRHEAIRSRLELELERAGFDMAEADYILSSLRSAGPGRAAFVRRLR